MPCMSASGNISPQSMSRQPAVLLEDHAVATDLPQAAEEGDADRCSHAVRRDGRGVRERVAPALRGRRAPRGPGPRAQSGVGPIGRRALARRGGRGRAASPWSASGSGASSPVSKAKLSSRRALTRRAPSMSPLSHRSNISWWSGAAPVGGHADHADRADGQQRQGHRVVAAVDLEAVRRAGDRPRRSRRGCPAASLSATHVRAPRGPGASSVAVLILRPVRTGMS